VISAVVGFLNLPALRRIRRLRRDSFALAMLTLLGVLLLGVLGGLLLLNRQSRPDTSVSAGSRPATCTWPSSTSRPPRPSRGCSPSGSTGLAEAVGEARIYRSLADAIPDARAALRA
jgi:hypothetical protein